MTRRDRIHAAYSAQPAVCRLVALVLLGEMLRDPTCTSLCWSHIGLLLRHCSIELMGKPHTVPPVAGDWSRALFFGELADKAHDLAEALRWSVRAPAVANARKRCGRVIDVAEQPRVAVAQIDAVR